MGLCFLHWGWYWREWWCQNSYFFCEEHKQICWIDMLFIDKYMLLSYNIYYQEILYFDWLISKILCYHSSVSITLPFALPLADYWCKRKHRVKNIEKPTDVHWKWVSILSLAIAFTKTACGKNFKTFVSVFFQF